jgi:hypothetical protein
MPAPNAPKSLQIMCCPMASGDELCCNYAGSTAKSP